MVVEHGVTVNELLQLPSFRGAEVLTGRDNLHRTVSSLSVLEVSNVDFIRKLLTVYRRNGMQRSLSLAPFTPFEIVWSNNVKQFSIYMI